MKKLEKYTAPLGMIGVIAYFIHTILGQILWSSYNPITTYISSLTAVGAPNRDILLIFTNIYGIAMLLFTLGLVIKSFRKYPFALKTGYIVMFIMQLVSFIGFGFFPLVGDITEINFSNIMHIIVTVIVVFTSLASNYFLAYGYLKQKNKLGKFILIMAIVITIAGFTNPISMGLKLNILGLTERLVIYSLQFTIFVISAYYTFNKLER